MEWIERLNDAIGYIEEHLTDEMNYRIETKDAFHIAGVSVPLHKDIEKILQ